MFELGKVGLRSNLGWGVRGKRYHYSSKSDVPDTFEHSKAEQVGGSSIGRRKRLDFF